MSTLRRDVFHGMADPTRRDILALIADKPMNLNAIAENFDISRPAISQHIKVLSECGLVDIKQEGRERYCQPKLETLNEAAEWIEPFRKKWEAQFKRLDNLLEELQSKPNESNRNRKNKE